MEMIAMSTKCAACSLANFASETTCRRYGGDLPVTAVPPASAASYGGPHPTPLGRSQCVKCGGVASEESEYKAIYRPLYAFPVLFGGIGFAVVGGVLGYWLTDNAGVRRPAFGKGVVGIGALTAIVPVALYNRMTTRLDYLAGYCTTCHAKLTKAETMFKVAAVAWRLFFSPGPSALRFGILRFRCSSCGPSARRY